MVSSPDGRFGHATGRKGVAEAGRQPGRVIGREGVELAAEEQSLAAGAKGAPIRSPRTKVAQSGPKGWAFETGAERVRRRAWE